MYKHAVDIFSSKTWHNQVLMSELIKMYELLSVIPNFIRYWSAEISHGVFLLINSSKIIYEGSMCFDDQYVRRKNLRFYVALVFCSSNHCHCQFIFLDIPYLRDLKQTKNDNRCSKGTIM